jgi:hypothetical protein
VSQFLSAATLARKLLSPDFQPALAFGQRVGRDRVTVVGPENGNSEREEEGKCDRFELLWASWRGSWCWL